MALPSDDALRKQIRAFQGFVSYFPDATALVAYLSKVANEQHNPGEPMHWAKEKSTEELDSLMNHLIDIAANGPLSQDSDGILDAVKVAWRGMANLQRLADDYGLEQLIEFMQVPAPDDWAAEWSESDQHWHVYKNDVCVGVCMLGAGAGEDHVIALARAVE